MTFSLSIPSYSKAKNRAWHRAFLMSRLLETGTLTHPSFKGLHLRDAEGAVSNAAHTLRAAAKDTDADDHWVVHLEDDIDIINDLLGSLAWWLQCFATPSIRFYPLGANMRFSVEDFAHGFWDFPVRKFYGACGLAMRRDDALSIANWLTHTIDVDENRLDLWLRQWHLHVEPTQDFVRTPVPSFIDHLGAVSSLATAGEKGHWTGRYLSFDRTHREL